MKQINLGEATAELPSLIDLASKGESFVITKGRVRLARLGPLGDPAPKKKFEFDTMKGWIWIADDFDAPLPKECPCGLRGSRYRMNGLWDATE
jgi:antitoxin (DNA-binding transcriptional repressor) of toxin-antitoxin stability system